MPQSSSKTLQDILNDRFGDMPATNTNHDTLHAMAARGSCRVFTDQPVAPELLKTLCAVALSSPTKSDLQQRDIVVLQSPEKRAKLARLTKDQAWIADAPMILIFCGNNRRQRLLHDWHTIPFANDHLDALINATADAAIALGAFVTAAEAVGLGTCPISAVRNKAQAVSDMLNLPDHVFPFAGLALGHPAHPPELSMRLPLGVTCHVDAYAEDALQSTVAAYDTARRARQPYANQRFPQTFGESPNYGWSEDKARQYSHPERADFGQFIRAKGFCLD
ncbi:MAG: nitroreductase family protein [Pseudomonadota bacterium]